MKTIYLFCSGGMSTSLLAQRMQRVADDYGLPLKVEAFSSTQLDKIVEDETPDCILFGPQLGFMADSARKKYGFRVPVGNIDAQAYGELDAERVLKAAILLIKSESSRRKS